MDFSPYIIWTPFYLDGIDAPNMSEAFTICSNLGSSRLLLVEAGNKDVHQRVRLNVNIDDALFAFKSRGS